MYVHGTFARTTERVDSARCGFRQAKETLRWVFRYVVSAAWSLLSFPECVRQECLSGREGPGEEL